MIKKEYVCKTLMNMTRKCHIMFYRLTPYGISLSYSLMFYRLTPFYNTIQYNTIQYNTTIINNILCMFIIQTIDCFSIYARVLFVRMYGKILYDLQRLDYHPYREMCK